MSRIRADQLVNRAGSGGPKFPNGVADGFSVSGIVTATSYRGDGSQLTGIDASSLKDGSNVKVQAVSGGANVTGNVAATGNVTAVDGTFSGNATVQGNLTVNGTTTTIDTAVTAVDSLAIDGNITIGSTVDAPDYTDGGSAKAITIGAPGDALLITHSSGQGLGYFGYEAGGDRLVVACDGGSGSNKIDFITDAGTTAGADNLDGKVPKMRIGSNGSVGFNTTLTTGALTVNIAGDYKTSTQNVADEGLIFQSFTTASTGDVYPGISWTGNPGALGRARASITAVATNNNNGSDLVFLTRNQADGTEIDVTDDEKLRITSGGNILPGADNTQDLGSSSKRFANIYTGDLNLSNEGSANDVDGTWGQYTIQEGEDDLFLINRRTGKKYKFNLTEVD